MGEIPGSGVRPTRRAVSDLGVQLPNVGTPLDKLAHELVEHAQRLPELYEAGGAKRVLSLDDRVWFKVKTGRWRSAATLHPIREEAEPLVGQWWLGGAGLRTQDSSQDDFYDVLEAECIRERKALNKHGTPSQKATSTGHLLPQPWDRDRLEAELAFNARRNLKLAVRSAAAMSIRCGRPITFDFGQWEVVILVRADHGEAFIAICAVGLTDPDVYALLLDSIPGISSDAWLPEGDGGVAGIEPIDGQVIFSTYIPPATADRLLEDFPEPE